MIFDVDIAEAQGWSGKRQLFNAVCRETGDRIERSADPEHDMARVITGRGLPDGEMQTWRGNTPSVLFASVHHASHYSVGFENTKGWRLRRVDEIATERVRLEAAE